MKHDSSDQEIDQLYQQRKQSIKAPNIALNEANGVVLDANTYAKPSSIGKMLMVLILGSSASFGILAIISHLAVSSSSPEPLNEHYGVIEIDEMIQPVVKKEPFIPVAPLPPKPTSKGQEETLLIELEEPQPLAPKMNSVNQKLASAVVLPELNLAETELTPEFKVMPQYPTMAIRDKRSGSIKLSYRITEQGRVVDIQIEENNVNQQLKHAAKQALKQWRYQENSQVIERQAVVFEFNLGSQ